MHGTVPETTPGGEGPQTMTQYIALEKFMAHSGMHDADK